MLNNVKTLDVPAARRAHEAENLYLCRKRFRMMKKSRFRAVFILAVLSMSVLTAVEAWWVWRMYDDQRTSLLRRVSDIFDSMIYRHGTLAPASDGSSRLTPGMLDRLAAAVDDEFSSAGIDLGFCIEVLAAAGAESVAVMRSADAPALTDPVRFDRQACPLVLRLSVDNPRPMIFGGMRWILLASAGIVVLLAATFLYILHTLFRAKSLEMMRRDLTHNITHELKTPIAVAYASCDALRSMPDMARDDAVRGEYLDMVLSQLSSLSQMVEQILQASLDEGGRAPLQLTECRLGPLVDSLMREMNMKYASKRIAWHVDVGQDAAVAADRFLLTGILSNLIDNAVKYSSREPNIGIGASVGNGIVTIRIRDDGCGIPQRDRRRIFEKFYRIPRGDRHDTRGYGLGLYFVATAVARHGGSVEAGGAHGGGSIFTVKLPRYGRDE